MSQKELVKLFENRNVRVVWDDEKQEWYFSVVDVCGVLTDSVNPTDYLKKMRKRDPELNIFMGTNCPQVLMTTETGKRKSRTHKSGSTDRPFCGISTECKRLLQEYRR
jgi:prophage antirepressor-like protein